jgi:carbon starvation protein CstA
MRRLRDGEWLAGAAALLLLASLFLDWYGVGAGGASAWQAFGVLDVVLAALALVPLALVVTQATRRSPAIPVALSVLTTLAGALAALLIVVRLIAQPGPNALVTVEPGAWLGLLAAVLVTAGGWRSMRVEAVPHTAPAPIEQMTAPAP